MTFSTTTTKTTAPPDTTTDAGTSALRLKRRRQRQHMVKVICANYLVDFSLLALLSVTGALDMHQALAYLGGGTAVSAFFYVLLGSGWSDRFQDHHLTAAQMCLHAAVNLIFTIHAPQVGLLMLMLVFVHFTFGALRANPHRIDLNLVTGAGGVGLAVVLVVALMGDRLGMPTDTWQQRLLCGVWVALILFRSTLAGMYGARLRQLLNKRNSELAATFERLDQMANRDELTGTLNRRSVMKLLDEERQRMARTGQVFGVALFDIDHFKQVNDTHGHQVGDDTLRFFTQVAETHMRTTDRLGRYGGEEFLMLLTATSDEAAAQTAAERVREGMTLQDWSALTPGLKVTVSAGVALARHGESAMSLLSRADHALYIAKRQGRNRVFVAET